MKTLSEELGVLNKWDNERKYAKIMLAEVELNMFNLPVNLKLQLNNKLSLLHRNSNRHC